MSNAPVIPTWTLVGPTGMVLFTLFKYELIDFRVQQKKAESEYYSIQHTLGKKL